jgi:ribosomal protein S18 acetylase RimI-like enzyme
LGGHRPSIYGGKYQMSELKIRLAEIADVPLILQFIHDLAKYERALSELKLSTTDLEQTLFSQNPQAYCLISEIEGVATGFAVWHLNYSTWVGQHGIYLEDLYVDPKFRGLGHGKALIRKLAQICIERGYKRLQWSVLNWNEPAIEFYKSLGAKPMDDWTVYRVSESSLEKLATEGN